MKKTFAQARSYLNGFKGTVTSAVLKAVLEGRYETRHAGDLEVEGKTCVGHWRGNRFVYLYV